MIYAYDTEFLENGRTIDLISIGIVAEDGETYYAINVDAPWGRIEAHPWLRDNVLPMLLPIDRRNATVKPLWVIANEVRDFLLRDDDDGALELWASYGAYDHVVLAQLYGNMAAYPDGLPMFTHDIQQEMSVATRSLPKEERSLPEEDSELDYHHALSDAIRVMRALQSWGIARYPEEFKDFDRSQVPPAEDWHDRGGAKRPKPSIEQRLVMLEDRAAGLRNHAWWADEVLRRRLGERYDERVRYSAPEPSYGD